MNAMKVNLAYGKRGLQLELPDKYNIDNIEPKWTESVNDQQLAITEALLNPIGSPPLKEIITPGDKIAIVFSDITRATPYHIIVPALLEQLKIVPNENICFFCATGTHRSATQEELVKILGENVVKNYEIIQNDANDPGLHKYVGTTTSGNKIFLNKKILSYDLKILTGFIEPHIFAGFSGGGKALIPGMAAVDSIKYNHSIQKLSSDNVTWGITYGNPLWEEIMEVAEFVPNLFLLNIALNKNKDITKVFAGDLRTAHKAGCEYVKESAMVAVKEPYDIIITSNSGFPLDLNIYQTVKGMSAAAQIVKKDGKIIMAAECWDGIPSNTDYEKILSSVGNVEDLMNFIKANEKSLKDTWQIYFQVLVQQRADVYFYSDKIDATSIRKTLLNPTDNIQMLIDNFVQEIGPNARICILPEGPQTIPYLEN